MPSQIEANPRDTPPAAGEESGPPEPHGEDAERGPDAEVQRSLERGTGSAGWASLACFTAALCAIAFVGCAVWQAGAIVTWAMAAADRPPGAASAPAPPAQRVPSGLARPILEPVTAAVGSVALVSVGPTEFATAGPESFEARAEASERAIPTGVAALLEAEEETFALGEPPPNTSPRMSCDDVFVYIVTIAEGAPMRSAASLGIGNKGPARLRHPGGRIGDYSVLAIADDWTGLEPTVWLERDGRVCPAQLAGNPARVHSALQRPPPPRRTPRKRRKARRR